MAFYCVTTSLKARTRAQDTIYLVAPVPEVSLRFSAQWQISQSEKNAINKIYGPSRINFDPQGNPSPQGLAPHCVNRWHRLYKLCMCDGCYYCDASEGSCETGTCGPNNSYCKPYMDDQGNPKCGSTCSDYAFAATLQ
jgi:hypothetical protein